MFFSISKDDSWLRLTDSVIMLIGENNMIKMIAMDMDGTLLDENNRIMPETKKVLMKLQKQGIRLVLASGRSYRKLLPYAQELGMMQYGGYLVEVNGSAVYDLKQQKRDVLARMKKEQIHEVFHYFMKWDVEIIGQFDDGMFDYIPDALMEEKRKYRIEHHLPDDFPWTAGAFEFLFDNREAYPKLTYIKEPEEIQMEINKVSVAYHPQILSEITKQAKEELKDRYWIGLTSPRWLEIMIPGVTKATGLAHVANISSISLDDMIAFGDGENDIEMLQEVGIGVAMGNAFENVKQVADDVTLSNREEGIAYALKKYFDL